ncbi:MAG TPA: TAXI family TRAP transporter solute-binding subunit [Nitrospirales bacterium]|nr:TAXI family TRAP transporter solute-binding subunit [Nitrospirales bacterium]
MSRWRLAPLIVVSVILVIFAYGVYRSLTGTQVIRIASGTPGGGFYEVGQRLEQVLNNDLHEQQYEAPVVFTRDETHGPRENLEHLAERKAQLGLVTEGLTVRPKEPGGADIRGLVKLSSAMLHVVVSDRVSRQVRKPVTQFTDVIRLASALGRPLRIYTGSPRSGTHAVVELLLTYYKIVNRQDLKWEIIERGSAADTAMKFVDGEIDVVCLLVSIDAPAVVTMSHHGQLVSLDPAAIDAIHTLRPALIAATIPAGVYNRDFPKTPITTLGANTILVANAEISNRLAYRIVRAIGIHWQELQSGMLLPEDFRKAQVKESDYFSLHPGAVAYYKGDNLPLWPWFEDKVRLMVEHRDVVLSIGGGIPTLYALLYAWYQRRRVRQLMNQIAALKEQGTIERSTIENIRMHALTLLAQGKLNRDSYATLNEFIDANLQRAALQASQRASAGGKPSEEKKEQGA